MIMVSRITKFFCLGLLLCSLANFGLIACSEPALTTEPDADQTDTGEEDTGTSDADSDGDADDAGEYDGDSGESDADVDHNDADSDADIEPFVAFASPANDASVDNPVIFQIEAHGIDEVEIFADETYSLGPAFDPSEEDEFLYRFVGTGSARSLHVAGRVDGEEVARADLTITVNHDTCEDRFFLTRFASHNEDTTGELDMVSIRESSLLAIKDEIGALQSCGAQITLGAMLSLLSWEAAFRAGSFNTKCNENSYHNTESDCDLVAEAFYSYQFGIGGIHTSNFHPCRGGSWTQGMRALFEDLADQAGYPTDSSLVTDEVATRFAEVCPDATPSAIDYYILGAHEPFEIPRNDNGNRLEAVGHYPLLDPNVSVQLTFNILHGQCSAITDDRDAYSRWGGGDPRYGQEDHQDRILAHYENFAAANCD